MTSVTSLDSDDVDWEALKALAGREGLTAVVLYAPAKLSSYMAAGKPIVAVLNGEGAEVVKEADCGWTLPAGDAEGFAQLALELSHMDKTILDVKGQNALSYYQAHYIKEDCLQRLDCIMNIAETSENTEDTKTIKNL